MRDVFVAAVGQAQVGEQWNASLRDLAHEALSPLLDPAGKDGVGALYVGNMLSGELAGQELLGALLSDHVGWRGLEALKVEAGSAAGGAAVRVGYLAVASGLHDLVAVLGVEKVTDAESGEVAGALALATDGDHEAAHGVSLVSQSALLMQRYMHEFDAVHEDFAAFSVNAHRNAVSNPNAMFRRPITTEEFASARMLADPVNLLDSAPVADGAAALLLGSGERARQISDKPVRIAASSVATDSVSIAERSDPLSFGAAHRSAQEAYRQAAVGPADIDLFELHDAFALMAALSLEAGGFADRGRGLDPAREGEIAIEGSIPISTMGGLKGRGHPVGATGVYQIVEVVQQLQGEAEANQIPDCRVGMAQSLGGIGATAITHILEAPG
ncbi:MAG: thiolase domain-containing protein [Anaerolineae bacterium]